MSEDHNSKLKNASKTSSASFRRQDSSLNALARSVVEVGSHLLSSSKSGQIESPQTSPVRLGTLVESAPTRIHRYNSVVFMHIPKTGGTSIHEMLAAFFEPEEIFPERFNKFDTYQPDDLAKYRYFSGHMDIKSIELFLGPKYVLSMFREPKKRILSLYYFWRSHTAEHIEKHSLNGPRLAKSMDLLSFLREHQFGIPGNIDNIQTRTLLGPMHCGPNREFLFPHEEVLDRAFRAIDSIDRVGILENFDESCFRIFKDLGLSAPAQFPHLRNGDNAIDKDPNREAVCREEITPEIDRELDRLTEFDRHVYDYAVKVFESERS